MCRKQLQCLLRGKEADYKCVVPPPPVGGHDLAQIKWKGYDKIDTLKTRITREDGHESNVFRWDFKPQPSATNVDDTSFATFLEYFQKDLWPEFVEHHDLAVW